jgi:hypothetical protein
MCIELIQRAAEQLLARSVARAAYTQADLDAVMSQNGLTGDSRKAVQDRFVEIRQGRLADVQD